MNYLNRYGPGTLAREVSLLLVAVIWWIPFYVLITVMLKSSVEAMRSPFSVPTQLELSNFSKAWQGSSGVGLGTGALNSAIITAGSVLALIAVGSISAYVIARQGARLSNALYLAFVLGIILPAQLGIVPIYVGLRQVGLLGTHAGAILLYTGLLLPLSVFLYTGFVRALPRDYEEAAFIDGASRWQAFTRIVFPLLSSVTGTVAVLTAPHRLERFLHPTGVLWRWRQQPHAAGGDLLVCRRVRVAMERGVRGGRHRAGTGTRAVLLRATLPGTRLYWRDQVGSPMHFSVFLTARSMQPDQDATIIQAMTDFALQAEELGFDAVFCPDHHFTGYGPMGCDPFLYQAYLAGQLKRMRFGFSVVTGSLHHPVRFVERMNLLDQLTRGRLLVGIGSGTTPEETIGFGVKFQDSRQVLDENIDIAMRLWAKDITDDPVEFDTAHYRGAVVQRIVPRSFRRAVSADDGRRAARLEHPARGELRLVGRMDDAHLPVRACGRDGRTGAARVGVHRRSVPASD